MTASPLSSSLPPVDPSGSIGGGVVAAEAKGADGKVVAGGRVAFEDVLRQLGSMFGDASTEAPPVGPMGRGRGAKTDDGEIAIEPAADHAAKDNVAAVVVPFAFLMGAPIQAPAHTAFVTIPQQALDAGKTPFVEAPAQTAVPTNAPATTVVPDVTAGNGDVAAAPLALSDADATVEGAPATPSVASRDAHPNSKISVDANVNADANTDTDAVAKVLEAVKRTVPAHDRYAVSAQTTPAGRTEDAVKEPQTARVGTTISEIAHQLTAAIDRSQAPGDRASDDEARRGNGRHTRPAIAADQRSTDSSSALNTPHHANGHVRVSAGSSAPAEAPAEPATHTVSAAPAFAAHVALETPAGPRLMAAPGFAAHLGAAPVVMDRELPEQIVQAVRMQFAAGGGDAVVRLQPHFLGEVVVSIRVEQGVVTAALQSDTPAVRQWIETHEGSLRSALADQGLQLDRLVVTADAATQDGEDTARREQGDPESPEERQRRPRKRRNTPDDQATFEVFV